jgi:CP family cyanate transporter-like MFS transporter
VHPVVVLILSWFVAFNLRSGFVGLGPALPALTSDLGLTFAQASLLVSLPTLLMGLMAVPGGSLADRWGAARVIAISLLLVALGGGLRAVSPVFTAIFAISIVFGAGIGLGQPALPRLMRGWFPNRLGVTTGVYASGMVCGSILGAVVSGLLLARAAGHDAWRVPVAVWGALAACGLVVWLLVMQPWRDVKAAPGRVGDAATPPATAWSPWRDRRMRLAAAIFGAQGLVYYLLVAWLPAVYSEAGADATSSAALFAVFNGATLPGILLMPIWSDRLHSRRLPTFVASSCFLIGVLGLQFLPLAQPWRWLWPALAGAGVAGVFGMGLVLPADIAPRGRTGAAAGMVLALGYAASALGPVIAGVARDLTGSFSATLTLLPAVGVVMTLLALCTPELAMPGRETTEEGAWAD